MGETSWRLLTIEIPSFWGYLLVFLFFLSGSLKALFKNQKCGGLIYLNDFRTNDFHVAHSFSYEFVFLFWIFFSLFLSFFFKKTTINLRKTCNKVCKAKVYLGQDSWVHLVPQYPNYPGCVYQGIAYFRDRTMRWGVYIIVLELIMVSGHHPLLLVSWLASVTSWTGVFWADVFAEAGLWQPLLSDILVWEMSLPGLPWLSVVSV